MRLYLSSFRLGDQPDRLLALMRRPGPVAVIPNAIDMCEPEVRAAGVQRELDDLGQLGLQAEVLDLRDFGEEPERLRSELEKRELVWVRGGNVFVLREAFRSSGLDRLLPALLAEDSFVYAGYSAGPCMLAPSLAGLEHCDPLADLRVAYGDVPPTFEGLGVLPVAFVPHVDSPGHPETDLLGEVARRYAASGVPHLTLRDGEAVVLDGDPTQLALP
jgi:dipeptidase E